MKLFNKLCDTIRLSWNRNHSDNISTKAKTDGIAQTTTATTQNGDSRATSVIIEELHMYPQTEGDREGKRRLALRELGKAIKSLGWAIEQSKNPLNADTPNTYLDKLEKAFDDNYEFLTQQDINQLEPLVSITIRCRQGFRALEEPYKKLSESLAAL